MKRNFIKISISIIFLTVFIVLTGCSKKNWPTDPPDSERPKIIDSISTPLSGSIMVPTSEKLQLHFTENMEVASLNESVKIYKDNNTDPIAGKWAGDNGIYTFTPSSQLEALSRYSVVAKGAFDEGENWQGSGIRDINGNSVRYDTHLSFSTAGDYGTAPFYLGRGNPGNPSEGQTGIGVVTNFETTVVGDFQNEGSLFIELNPSGSELYISSMGDNSVSVMETANATIVATVPMPDGVEEPWFPAFTPNGAEVWVLCRGTNDVVVINTTSRSVVATVALADYCHDGAFLYKMAINHAGTMGYISTRTGQSVIVVDILNKSVVTSIENVVEEEATGEIVVLPDDSKVLVCNNWAAPSFRIIDAATNTVESELELGAGGDAYFTDVADNYLYMAGRWGAYIYKVDLTDFSIVAEINVAEAGIIDEMQGIAVDAAKQVVYVVANTYEEGSVLIFRESDLQFLGAIHTGPWIDIVVKK